MKPVRMCLAQARDLGAEEIKEDFIKKLAELKTEKVGLEVDHVFVFVTTDVTDEKGCWKYKSEDLDTAVELFMQKSRVNGNRLFVGIGVDYTIGAQDLIITGTDY